MGGGVGPMAFDGEQRAWALGEGESGGGVGTLDSFQNPRRLNTSERGLGGHLTQHLAVYI